jgi:hypothetical protein
MDATLNITINGQNGSLRDLVSFNASDDEVKAWATEAVRHGDVSGIDADPNASFDGYVIDRYPEKDSLPARLIARPKTPFGL